MNFDGVYAIAPLEWYKKYGISGDEIIILSYITYLTEQGKTYDAGKSYFVDKGIASRRTIIKYFKNLVEKGLIEEVKTKNRTHLSYRSLLTNCAKIAQVTVPKLHSKDDELCQNYTVNCAKIAHNNNINNNNINNKFNNNSNSNIHNSNNIVLDYNNINNLNNNLHSTNTVDIESNNINSTTHNLYSSDTVDIELSNVDSGSGNEEFDRIIEENYRLGEFETEFDYYTTIDSSEEIVWLDDGTVVIGDGFERQKTLLYPSGMKDKYKDEFGNLYFINHC